VPPRTPLLAALLALHVACYWVVTRVTAARGPSVLWATTTAVDRWIPHLPWTWPLYWLAYPFIALVGGFTLLRLPPMQFRRATVALAAMTVGGALVQLVFPAQAPWPADPGPMQLSLHQSPLVMPYATLPSMHVAYSTVIAGMTYRRYTRPAVGWALAAVVLAIAVATLTLKEHVVLDAITGLLLAWLALRWWRVPPA